MPYSTDPEKSLCALEVAREAYEAFQDAWREVGRIIRGLDEWQWHRVDAYPSWGGDRDVGAGVDMLGWMAETMFRTYMTRMTPPSVM